MFEWFRKFVSDGKEETAPSTTEKTTSTATSLFSFGGNVAFKNQPEKAKKRSTAGYDFLFKVVLVGDSGVGKSCILTQFCDGCFFRDSYVSTIGVDFKVKCLKVGNKLLKFQLWDTTGQERYRSITTAYYRGASTALLIYDVTKRSSFESIERWNKELYNYTDSVRVLIGNKCDESSRREVTFEEGKKKAEELGFAFFEVSACDYASLEKVFIHCGKELLRINGATSESESEAEEDNVDDDSAENFCEEELKMNMDKVTDARTISGEAKHKHSKTDVNVFRLDLANIEKKMEMMTGDPTLCKHCGVVLNSNSRIMTISRAEVQKLIEQSKKIKKLETAPPIHEKYMYLLEGKSELHASDEESKQYWHCEFCDQFNAINIEEEEIPQSEVVDYLVAPAASDVKKMEDTSNIVFCIDISGSMCVTQELVGKHELKGAEKRLKTNQELSIGEGDQYLPGQSRNVTHVSRMQCIQAAIEQQIEKLAKEYPNKKVGLITFNHEVTIIGDGTQEPVVVTGDKLNSWKDLQKLASEFTIQQNVKQAKDKLIEKLWSLEESGATALGPALLLGIGIAGSHHRSGVILCTDGLANTGIGSLEGKEKEYTPFYTELAEQAKVKGVTVSVLSLVGTDCNLANVSVVAEQTGGEVERVDPLKITSSMSNILNTKVLAYGAMAMITLHRGLKFRGEIDDENEMRNWVVKDLGNVIAGSDCTISYGFRPKSECDLSGVLEIPFQVQLIFTRPDGTKCLRVATTRMPLTDDRKLAEENANVHVIGKHAVNRAARYAKDGNYEAAQMETRAAQRFMLRNKVKEEELKNWSEQVEQLDSVLREQKSNEISTLADTTEVQKLRKINRNDDATAVIAQKSKFSWFGSN